MRVLLAAIGAAFLFASCVAPDETAVEPEKPVDSGGVETPDIGELGGMCGGIAGFQCKAEGTYCKSEPGVCKDMADYAGTCVVQPEMCTMEYDPVCGCDGETYGNACSAAGQGVSVAYEGECAEG